MSRRTERIASLMRSSIADALRTELNDPRIEPLTSITRVDVSADLSISTIYVSVMSEKESGRNLTIEALQGASGRLRSLLAGQLTLRQVPALRFKLDDSIRGSIETVDAIDRLMAESGPSERADDRQEDNEQ